MDIIKLWKSYAIDTVAALEKYLHSFHILFAFNSGKIENPEITYSDTREIFENGKVLSFSGNPRTIFELQNQKLCYDFLKDKIIIKEQVSVKLIKEIHEALTAGTYDSQRFIANEERPGEFKKHDYVVGIHEVGSKAEDVEKEIGDLVEEINDYKGEDLLKAATYLHVKFLYIHPFADGNGRVGRTLMNYYLMINNHPPLIVYDEDKRFYYGALEKFDETEDLDSLYEFFKYQIEKTWEKRR